MLRSIIAAACLSLSLTGVVSAQDIRYQPDPDTPIGSRNPAAPAETAQFDFVVGDWDVEITFTNAQGQSNTYGARWHNVWIADGFVLMQEWRGPYATGSEVRQFNPASGQWEGFNIYAAGGTPKPTTARFEDGNMVVTITGSSDARGAFLNRETYTDIAPDSFSMHSDRSYDGGETWEAGAYAMTVTRHQ